MNYAIQRTAQQAFVALASLATALPTLGQQAEEETEDQPGGYVEEVVVTVERREQNLQDLGVTAYSFEGDDLKMQGVQDVTDLSELAPGLEIGNKGGNVEVWIRGVGSSNNTELGDPAAATHLDGVYLPRTAGIGSAFFDIGRVEVNVGPQGTLRGRNATAGSVNIIPWRPGIGRRELAARSAETGDYESRVYRARRQPAPRQTAPPCASRAIRCSTTPTTTMSGPLDLETAEAADNLGFSLQLLVDVNDRLSLLLAYDNVHEQGTGWTGTNYANPLGNGIEPRRYRRSPGRLRPRLHPDPRHHALGWQGRSHLRLRLGNLEYTASRRDLLYDYDAATPLSPDWRGVADDPATRRRGLRQLVDGSSSSPTASRTSRNCASSATPGPGRGRRGCSGSRKTSTRSSAPRATGGCSSKGIEFNQPNTDSSSSTSDLHRRHLPLDRPDATDRSGCASRREQKSRVGVNARYAFALGGRNFSCCGGVRLGTEGFPLRRPRPHDLQPGPR